MSVSKDILNRLRQVYKVDNNKELASKMGMNYNTLNVWINRDSIPYNKLHEIIQNESISFDWLISGKGNQYIKEDIHSDMITELNNIMDPDVGMSKYKKDVTHMEDELLESYRMLSELKQDYYYYKIKADALELRFKDA